MDRFSRDLKRILQKHLPQSNESFPSRRTEGAMVRRKEHEPHDYVAVIVDCEIDAQEYKSLSDKLLWLLKKDEFFKYSHYRVFLWKDNKLFFVNRRRTGACRLNRFLEAAAPGEDESGRWSDLWEMYKPLRKAGQVIMFTSSEKVEELRGSKPSGGRNLLILYQGSRDAKTIETVSGVQCIAYLSDRSHESIQQQ